MVIITINEQTNTLSFILADGDMANFNLQSYQKIYLRDWNKNVSFEVMNVNGNWTVKAANMSNPHKIVDIDVNVIS
jgi:hypothetical protein